jgi:hypothetical protein
MGLFVTCTARLHIQPRSVSRDIPSFPSSDAFARHPLQPLASAVSACPIRLTLPLRTSENLADVAADGAAKKTGKKGSKPSA